MAKKRKKHPAGAAASARTPAEKSARHRTRRQSTKQERTKVLVAAEKQGLTALEVQKRFGVKPVTWVAWFNGSRLLEPLGYVPPSEFEETFYRDGAGSAENGFAGSLQSHDQVSP